MALPLETEVYYYSQQGIEITLKHRHGDIAMIFMHNYIANIINEWDELYNISRTYNNYNYR